MKTQTNTNLFIRSSFALALALAIWSPVQSQSAEPAEGKRMMEGKMMQHMMQHMQKGKESMAQCPMMKGMKGMDEKSTGGHKEHQQEQK